MPNWDALESKDSKDARTFNLESLRGFEIRPTIDFLETYQPGLLALTLGIASEQWLGKMGKHYQADFSTLNDGKRFSAAWRRANLYFSTLCLTAAVQNDVYSIQILAKSGVLDILCLNRNGFQIYSAMSAAEDLNLEIQVRLNMIGKSRIHDGRHKYMCGFPEIITRFVNWEGCQKLYKSGTFSEHLMGKSNPESLRNSLLIQAAEEGNVNLARILLSSECLNGKAISKGLHGSLGRNVISTAIDNDHAEFARTLLAEDLTTNFGFYDEADRLGETETALSRACEQGLTDIAHLLFPRYSRRLLPKAPKSRRDLREVARSKGHLNIVEMFDRNLSKD